jgi:hypothetical protein
MGLCCRAGSGAVLDAEGALMESKDPDHVAVPRSGDAAFSTVDWRAFATVKELDAMQDDARRYRWLRDRAIWRDPPNADGDMVWCVIGPTALYCRPCESDELDSFIDAALLANMQPSSQPSEPDEKEGA